MNHNELVDGMIGQRTVSRRCDDDDVADAKLLDDGWDLSGETVGPFSEVEKAHVNSFVLLLAKEDRRENANFIKLLEVGTVRGCG